MDNLRTGRVEGGDSDRARRTCAWTTLLHCRIGTCTARTSEMGQAPCESRKRELIRTQLQALVAHCTECEYSAECVGFGEFITAHKVFSLILLARGNISKGAIFLFLF